MDEDNAKEELITWLQAAEARVIAEPKRFPWWFRWRVRRHMRPVLEGYRALRQEIEETRKSREANNKLAEDTWEDEGGA